jgi:hypothetical protein
VNSNKITFEGIESMSKNKFGMSEKYTKGEPIYSIA